MAKFRIVHQQTSIEAPEGVFLIGRSQECNLVLDDPSVSRIHGAVIFEGGRLYAEDRGSRNGVKVNDEPIAKRREIFDNDRMSIGKQNILILSGQLSGAPGRTQGLSTCRSCGKLFPSTDGTCPHCRGREVRGSDGLRDTKETPVSNHRSAERGRFDTISEHQPIAIRASLAQKAIRVGKHEEAERLVKNSIDMAIKKVQSGDLLSRDEYETINEAIIALADETRRPDPISLLFRFHLTTGKLMTRELVEKLYEVVRRAGYRQCPEMSGYLDFLSLKASDLSPGERFVHKRLEGLVKLCS
jgi:hypothetical protein